VAFILKRNEPRKETDMKPIHIDGQLAVNMHNAAASLELGTGTPGVYRAAQQFVTSPHLLTGMAVMEARLARSKNLDRHALDECAIMLTERELAVLTAATSAFLELESEGLAASCNRAVALLESAHESLYPQTTVVGMALMHQRRYLRSQGIELEGRLIAAVNNALCRVQIIEL
jgi:hypothetical protein